MQIHKIEYEFMPLATVEIDETKSTQPINEMVDFWSNREDRLRHAKGDYTKAWLTQLALYIIRNGQPPEKDEEGWYPLDGTHGITLRSWDAWEPDEDAISFE